MKSITKAALAVALVSGTAIVAPVQAKEKPAAAPAFKFSSQQIVAAIDAAKVAVNGTDMAAAEPLVAQVEAQAQNDDDKFAANTLRLVLESKKLAAAGPRADRTPLVKPYTALLANPKTLPADKASYALDLGIIYYNSKQYPQAITYFQQAQQLGSTDPNLSANIVRAKIASGDASGGLTELESLIQQQTAAKGKADEELYRYGLSRAIQAKDGAATLSWIKRYLTAYPTPANWRTAIKIYGLQQGSFITPTRAQSLDLYRLLRATGGLDQYDYEAYARAANQSGIPWEAKTVITEGRAKGKVPATGDSATLLTAANNGIAAEGSLAPLEARSKTAADGKLASQTADAQLGSANYAKAVELYRLALQKGGVNTAEVNLRLGIALAMSGDKAGAKAAFAAVQGAPSADIAALWTTYLDVPAAPAA